MHGIPCDTGRVTAEEHQDAKETKPRVPWLVVLLAAGGTELLPDQRLLLAQVPMEPEPADVALATRYEDTGLPALLPRELVLEIRVLAEDADAAVSAAGAVAGGVVALVSFAVNAFVCPPEPHLAYEEAPGLSRRRFWQREVELQHGVPRPRRLIKPELLFPLLEAFFRVPESDWLSRAVSQYHVALGQWTTRGRPLAMAHLYMALEALAPAAERAERARLGLADKREHAAHRGVDTSLQNWEGVLLGWVRRDVLCRGDRATYTAARRAHNGFKHGFMSLPDYRAVAELHTRALLDYVRSGLLNLLDLSDEVRNELVAKPPVDVSAVWQEIRGELLGAVQDPQELGEGSAPYPYADWSTTLDDAHRTEDGRLRISSRVTLVKHLAPGVLLDATYYGQAVGLNDADLFDYEPPAEQPLAVRAGSAPADEPEERPAL